MKKLLRVRVEEEICPYFHCVNASCWFKRDLDYPRGSVIPCDESLTTLDGFNYRVTVVTPNTTSVYVNDKPVLNQTWLRKFLAKDASNEIGKKDITEQICTTGLRASILDERSVCYIQLSCKCWNKTERRGAARKAIREQTIAYLRRSERTLTC